MRIYIYRCTDEEKVPEDVTHVIIHEEVTTVPKRAFWDYDSLLSVVMHDGVTRIEYEAFADCTNLRYIRLSRSLEYIGESAFDDCQQLRGLFLPPTLRDIGNYAFASCLRLRIFMLPSEIILEKVGSLIVADCSKLFTCPSIQYREDAMGEVAHDLEVDKVVNEWLQDRERIEVELSPLHLLCHDTHISGSMMDGFFNEHGSDAASEVDQFHQMTALHVLTMNPHSTQDAIVSCVRANPSAAFHRDEDGYTPIDNAMQCNVPGLISMMKFLCVHRDRDLNRNLDSLSPNVGSISSSPKSSRGKKRKRCGDYSQRDG
mmetsp:Transcript_3321/g.3868  ORF Transcript_3321/g.3868 Transcript_3321/m.3868 type:complete len:316 (-) Transcript_3321:280-1227(-)|eukprot:CAMPEP_0204643630 /NCGR_PEP_ID=MMETSP0718-20130828/863_1 /ASSEMBLY_ACC=CAM_ASM_000674 /TAXON_ID=230516 /ORGANISM="Chaetoceros curvisetus" /LENGTH=315 /DNA_ID=CAMNT_0051664923 /DNA_START=163 /DNA_END=1110 /DNA_ORIENTATION=+